MYDISILISYCRLAMPQEREFGKLTAEQLRQLISHLPMMESVQSKLREVFLSKPGRYEELAGSGVRWSSIYELPIEQHLARLAIVGGEAPTVMAALSSEDPHQTLLDSIGEESADADDVLSDRQTFRHLLGMLFGLCYSFESVMVYGRYLNELIADARKGGHEGDDALLKAIRIDPTVIAGPTAATRLSRALLFGEEEFLTEFRLAAQGKTGDQAAYLRRFRFVIKVLAESNALELPNKVLTKLVIDLGAYADVPGADKNVGELIRKAKIQHDISK